MTDIVFSLFERSNISNSTNFHRNQFRILVENKSIGLHTEDCLEFMQDSTGGLRGMIKMQLSPKNTKCFLIPCNFYKKIKDSKSQFQKFDSFVKVRKLASI